MPNSYQAVGFNRQKRNYDIVVGFGIVAYIILFWVVGIILYPASAPETILIRAFSTAAFGLLHIILSIGPLSRLSTRYLPLLYNRRHLGVLMALVASAHAAISILQFHSFGELHPLMSVLTGDGSYLNLSNFPFQPFGLLALVILLLMATTSHDFWLVQLSAPTWKRLHMLVYGAYASLVVHVVFGIGQHTESWTPIVITGLGATWIVSIHLLAAFRGRQKAPREAVVNGFVDVCALGDIAEGQAIGVLISGERVAVFKNERQIFAVSGVCQHQNGPLSEGRIIDGLITCPWHGFQYCPLDGKSPEPFTEVIPTFEVKLDGARVLVATSPAPEGEETQPATF